MYVRIYNVHISVPIKEMFIITLAICMVICILFKLIVIYVYVQTNMATCVQGSLHVYTSVHAFPRVCMHFLANFIACGRRVNACHTHVAFNLSLTCTV